MPKTLFEIKESYCLDDIFLKSREFIKKKYPPVSQESSDEYNQFIIDETRLEVAYRLRVIANQLDELANQRKCY